MEVPKSLMRKQSNEDEQTLADQLIASLKQNVASTNQLD